MARVVVKSIAQGVQATKSDLEAGLANAKCMVVDRTDGSPIHVEWAEASMWWAGAEDEYAIKAFKKGYEDCAEREFLKLEKLCGSRHIPPVLCYGTLVEDDGVQYQAIVRESVRGFSLAKIVEDGLLFGGEGKRPLGVSQAASIALELTRAVIEVEKVGLAYCGISHENVFLVERCVKGGLQDGADLFLVEFGSSMRVRQGDYEVFEYDSMRAHVPFGAPELFGGDYYNTRGLSSAKASVWSIGAMITYLMCGKECWSEEIKVIRQFGLLSEDKHAELCRIVEEKSKSIDLLKLTCQERGPSKKEEKLAEIVRVCTSYNPILRPSLGGLETALRKLVGEQWDGESQPILATDLGSQAPRVEANDAASKVSNESGKERGRKSHGRHAPRVAAAVGILGILCLLVLYPPFGVSKSVTDAIKSMAGIGGGTHEIGDAINDVPGCVAEKKQPDGHVYALVELNDDWQLAKERAESFGGHLVTIASSEEQRVVEEILADGTRNSYWLGGRLGSDGGWAWVTEEQFGYKKWATDQPDNFLVRTSHDDASPAPVEDALVVYRIKNPLAADDDGRNGPGFWNDLPHNGDCGGEAFFGVNNIGAIYEWDNGLS